MPKNIWKTKRRKKNRKDKTADLAQNAEIIERSRMPDPNDPTISIGMISDLSLDIPLKKEAVIYPNTRFQSSTTLFPAEGIEEKYQPLETSSHAFKRSAEDELISIMPKKRREDNLPKTKSTNSDDCEIIENPKKRVKIEVVDLIDSSHPIVSLLCSPVKTSFLENRLPGKLNRDLQANGNAYVKVESRENASEINANAIVSAGMDCHSIQANSKQNNTCEQNNEVNTKKSYVAVNKVKIEVVDLTDDSHSVVSLLCSPVKTSCLKNGLPGKLNTDHQANGDVYVKVESRAKTNEINTNTVVPTGIDYHSFQANTEENNTSEQNNEVNIDKSYVALNKNVDLLGENISRLQVKTEMGAPSESVNSDASSIKHPSVNCINIKTEKPISSVNDTEFNLENSRIAVSKDIDPTTHNIPLRSEVDKENVDYLDNLSRIQQKTKNIVPSESVNSDESSIKHSSGNRIEIKAEKGTSTEKNTEVNLENDHIVANKSADSSTPNIPLRSELDKENVSNRSINVTIKEEPKENCVVGDNSISLLNFPSDENRTGISLVDRPIKSEINKTNKNSEVSDDCVPVLKPVTQVKSEPEMMDFQNDNSCENPQNNEEISQIITNSNNLNTNRGIFSGDNQLYHSGTIRTSLLKYMNCNRKVEVCEISDALSVLKNLCNNSELLDYDEQNETSNSRQVEENENINKTISNDFLRQILSHCQSTNSNGITHVSSSLENSVDPVTKSNISVNDHSLSQMLLRKNKYHQKVNCITNANKRNSARTMQHFENFFKSLSAPPNNSLKRSSSVLS